MKTILLSLFLLSTIITSAQQITNIHIVTIPGNLVSPFKFNFTINDKAYKLKAGQCLELKLRADTINIILTDNRWVKNETININTAAINDLYVLIKLARNKEIMKGEFYMAEIICKECFDELKKKCSKEFSE